MEWEIGSQKNGNNKEVGCKDWDENGCILDVNMDVWLGVMMDASILI